MAATRPVENALELLGRRWVLRLVWELRRRSARYGIATLCVGVGQGVSLALERVN